MRAVNLLPKEEARAGRDALRAPFIAGEAPGEPSPASARETSAPEPEPAAPPAPERAAETEGADRPRRTGWWARRLAGKS